MYSALLSILGTHSGKLRPGDSPSAKDTKYTELIMKCLWKLAKTIQENLRSNLLNPDELLFEINQFFIDTPPSEWKRRANENVPLGEMPLRTVKTLLLELVNGLGDSIFQHLTLIEDPQRSSVYPYLHHMLEACRKKDRMQQQKQQQSPRLVTPTIQQPSQQQPMEDSGNTANRYMTHSRNSSLGRTSSISSLKSVNNVVRSPSNTSFPSADGEQHHVDSHSPRLSSPSLNNNQVQPMQIDEPPQPQQQPQQQQQQQPDANNGNTTVGGAQAISDHEINNTLTIIFQKIGTRDQTKQVKHDEMDKRREVLIRIIYFRVLLICTNSKRTIL